MHIASRMIRVTKTEEQSRTLLTIDGELSGDCSTVIETCYAQAAANGKPVAIFLRDITSVDLGCQSLLQRLVAKGVRLLASGVYTSYLVQSLSGADAAAGNSATDTEHLPAESTRRTR